MKILGKPKFYVISFTSVMKNQAMPYKVGLEQGAFNKLKIATSKNVKTTFDVSGTPGRQ